MKPLVRRTLWALLVLMLLLFFSWMLLHWIWREDLRRVSSLRVLEQGGRVTVLDSQGQVVGHMSPTLRSGQRVSRNLLRSSEISEWLKKAVVTSEDVRFYQHQGVDPQGLLRAVLNVVKGDLQGGSTLTQQVVKNTLIRDMEGARTLTRKVKEALLALKVEEQFNKAEILTSYLNVVYWGVGRTDLIGAGDAAQVYFGKKARDLNLAESVYLATLLPSPRRFEDYPAYRPLMKSLLTRMVETGQVTREEATAAWRYPLQPAGWTVKYTADGEIKSAKLTDPQRRKKNSPPPQVRFADGFLDQIERELVGEIGEAALYRSDVTIHTTLNRQVQEAAEEASRKANVPSGATLGMAFLDPQGNVLALVGQKLGDGLLEEWNHATRSRRQVGSAIKPLLYTLALEEGWKQSDTLPDRPVTGDYQPKNFSRTHSGQDLPLRLALDRSLNLPAVHLLQKVGLSDFRQKLTRLGLEPRTKTDLGLALGDLEASPLQMAAAYLPFSNGGTLHPPRLIRQVTQGERVLLDFKPTLPRRIWSEQHAYLGLDLLRGVVADLSPQQGGLAYRARIKGREVAGKTGTTNDVKDLWFVGLTPGLVGAVWVGNTDNTPMPQASYSGDIAAPIWKSTVEKVSGLPTHFVKPDGIQFVDFLGMHAAFLSSDLPTQQELQALNPKKPTLKNQNVVQWNAPAAQPDTKAKEKALRQAQERQKRLEAQRLEAQKRAEARLQQERARQAALERQKRQQALVQAQHRARRAALEQQRKAREQARERQKLALEAQKKQQEQAREQQKRVAEQQKKAAEQARERQKKAQEQARNWQKKQEKEQKKAREKAQKSKGGKGKGGKGKG